MKEFYQLTKAEALKAAGSTLSGLSESEALRRLNEQGENRLKEAKKKSLPALFFAQFKDLMTIILLCASLLSGVLAYLTRDMSEIADTGILLFVILLNALVGFIQEYRADSAIEKIKKLSSATARVVRSGRISEIDAAQLVRGDIIELSEGDRVPADCRVLESENFRCDESALTGESRPVGKRDAVVTSSALSDRVNEAHMGTFVVSGNARCLVTETGMDTEMGAIADLLHDSKAQKSPLDRTVAKLGKVITISVLIVAGILFFGGLLAKRVSFLDNLMTAVAVAVAAIPEGMGAVVTIILAVGVQRMSKERAVMRKLSAVETLGSCTCICSDKTGTLTKNKMTIEDVSCFSEDREETLSKIYLCMRMCHTVKGSQGNYAGDPTEIALVEYADRMKISCEEKISASAPFTSERKMMSVAVKDKLLVKGGADVILKKCSYLSDGKGRRKLTDSDERAIKRAISSYSAQAMRILAFAEGDYRGKIEEENLTFLGLAAMYDPPKEGVKEAVLTCRGAGIKTVMITGDSPETAFEIARRLEIASSYSEVATGEDLDRGIGTENVSVFARVSPRHKLEIVKSLQRRGEIVAMTGDGVNDAPSVKAADIGVAMGSGTDVTKDAADMVLSDDNFKTMVRAVEEGRSVFYNIKRTISFFLSTNLAEVLSVLFVTLFFWRYEFLTSTQLLWINLITDSLPVLALGIERTEGVMKKPPVSEKDIFSKRSMGQILIFGLLQTAIVVSLFAFGAAHWGNEAASTCAFLTLSLLELFHAFNLRESACGYFSNRALLLTAALGIALNVLLVFVPFLRAAFSLFSLSPIQWAAVSLSSLSILPLGRLVNFLFETFPKEKSKVFKKVRPV